jgi:hypothetical protein
MGQQMGYGSQMQLGGYGQSYGGQGQSEWAMVRYIFSLIELYLIK